MVKHINFSLRDAWAGVPAPNLGAPDNGRSASGKCRDDAVFAPDAVALRTEPLRPIIRGSFVRPIKPKSSQ